MLLKCVYMNKMIIIAYLAQMCLLRMRKDGAHFSCYDINEDYAKVDL